MSFYSKRCWAEIDLNALRQNLAWISHRVGDGVSIFAVVKADAYGHGLKEIASHLMTCGANGFGVANLKEAFDIRQRGDGWPILMLGACTNEEREYAIRMNVMVTISRLKEAELFLKKAEEMKRPIQVQVKVDTGMGRLGIEPKDAIELVQQIKKMETSRYLLLKGIYTHLAAAEDDEVFTRNQLSAFTEVVNGLKRKNIFLDYVHASSSAGVLFEDNQLFNTVRPGLILYGIVPTGERIITHRIQRFLRPALSLKCKVSFIKSIQPGKTISYGHTFTAERQMKVATLTAGYGDGYHRIISGKGYVLIRNRRCPILGRITMDQMIVDVSSVTDVDCDDECVLIGKQGEEEISITQVAQWANTIPWEILTSLNYRVPRIYIGGSAS